MLRKKTLLFSTVFIVIVALFGVTEVMAFSDYCSPNPPDLPITVNAGGYTITLESITEEASCTKYNPENYGDPYNTLGTATPCYRWNYVVHDQNNPSSITGLNFIALFIPDCECTDPYIYFDLAASVPSNAKIYPVGVGEPTVYLGRFNKSTYILKNTPSNDQLMSLVSTTNVVTTIPMALATGNKANSTTAFQGPGPGCTAPECQCSAGGGSIYTECVNWIGDVESTLDDVSFEIVRQDNRDGCIQSITFFTGFSCDLSNDHFTASRGDLPADYVSSGALHPGSCPDEGVTVVHSSPYYWYDVKSGGYSFQGCLDLNLANPTIGAFWTTWNYCGH